MLQSEQIDTGEATQIGARFLSTPRIFQIRVRGMACLEETALPPLFGEWLKRRRNLLDLTQVELADHVGCSVHTLRKIEAGARRPSKQLAGLLAESLEIPLKDRPTFIRVARGEQNIESLSEFTRSKQDVYGPDRVSVPSPGNLPYTLTRFIGREPEMAALGQLLRNPQCRLLTLAGPGGIGKTRLAIEIAGRIADLFPDGIWFVPLAPLQSSIFLTSAVADAIHFRFQDPTDPQEQLLSYLRGKRALLILDNAEHLLDGVGLFADILKHSLHIKLLVTSRETLNLLGEWVFEIQGLPVPPGDQGIQIEEYSSVALFLESARRNHVGFELREEDRPRVVRICQIMEGLPLGIELAAAWVGLLTCEEIAKEIERNLDFLAVSLRDVPERHRSLRATLDHSWNLLGAEEKAILSRLSVFQGGFRREAAEEICGAGLALLSSLKSKSLLRRTEQGYYDLHEFIRQYAALRLSEDAREDERVKDRHALYYAQRLSEWEQALKSSRQLEILNEIAAEIDNLRPAWHRVVTCCNIDSNRNTLFSPGLFRSSLFSLSLFFELRCRYWEAVNLLSQSVKTLKVARQAAARVEDIRHIDSFLGLLTAYLGYHQYLMHYLQARESLEEALRLLENDSSRVGKAQAQVMLAWVCQAQGQYRQAEDLFRASQIVFQQVGDEWWATLSLSMLAMVYLAEGNIDSSAKLFQESLERIEAGDLRLGAHARMGLGYACFFLGDYPQAERLLQESLALNTRLGNRRQVAYIHRLIGQVVLASGQVEPAQQHFKECIDILKGYGDSPDLALGLVYFGKSLAASKKTQAAREKFQKVIRIGQTLEIFYLVYWGLVNLARVFWLEGQSERALEMALILQEYSVESKVVQDDAVQLMAGLQAIFSPQEIEASKARIEGKTVDSLLDSL